MADVVKFEDAALTFERDKKVFRMRIGGASLRRIAEQVGCTVEEATASWIRGLGAVPPDFRARMAQTELERTDELQLAFWTKALSGNAKAAEIVLKCQERRAKLLGLDAQPHTDAPLDSAASKVKTTSTERITAALDRIVGKPNTVIDGDVVGGAGDTPETG
jgi:hypothetical protein